MFNRILVNKNFILLIFFFLSQFVIAQNEYQNPIPKLERLPVVKYRSTFDAIAIDTVFLKKKCCRSSCFQLLGQEK